MSAAVASRLPEADITGPFRNEHVRPKKAKGKGKSRFNGKNQNSSTKNGAQRHKKNADARVSPYTSVDKAQGKHKGRAQEQEIHVSEDERRRYEQELRNGELNLKFQPQKLDNLPPHDICQIHRHIFPIIRNWWIIERKDSHFRLLEKADNEIRAANRLAGRNEDMFLFPYKLISDHIFGALLLMERVQSMNKGPERISEATKLLRGQVFFADLMLQLNIDFKQLIHIKVRKKLDEIFNTPELEHERTELRNLFHKPTIRQSAILEPALELLTKFYGYKEDRDGDSMRRIISELNEINNRLVESNLEEGLKKDDHILPLHHLWAINDTLDEENLMTPEEREDIINTNSKRMEACLQSFGMSGDSVPKKHTEGVELPEEELRQMQEDVGNFEGPEPQESGQNDVSAEVEKPQQKKQSRKQHQNAGDSSPKLLSLPQTKPLISEEVYEGITDCGKILSVTKAGFGHRVFTNIGTDMVPVYKMFPGSCFPKSIRGGLHQKFASQPQPDGMEDGHIEILDTIKHPLNNGKSYTWVVYKWTREQNPEPRIMSLTDLTRRLGSKPAVTQVNNGLGARDQRLKILRLMRKSPNKTIAKGVPSFNECPPYMVDGLIDEEDDDEDEDDDDDDDEDDSEDHDEED